MRLKRKDGDQNEDQRKKERKMLMNNFASHMNEYTRISGKPCYRK